FSGEYDLRNRTAGAVFAGPPNFNTLYREFVDDRDPGSREVAPIYRDGRTIRFEDDTATPVEPASTPWDPPRVLYLQHASDPIVWWSGNLLLSRPDWLEEPRGRDVLGAMVWIPVVTFWQVTADLPMAAEVPSGHGHKYNAEHVDAWTLILQPTGWTPEQTDQLRRIVVGD
ncbi:MAG TPA: alpha/beta-hydrolase family protein, partial [Mycobacteriales bacterium]|nr:alpha/beta-hydrolase family protein [Mycobacteriales bacterium]